MATVKRGAARGRVDIDVDNNGKFFAKCHPMFEKELRRVIREIADRARHIVRTEHEKPPTHPQARKPTGNMRKSIQPYRGRAAVVHRTGPETISATVTAGSSRAKYTRYVHDGTRAHTIRAKPGGALVFVGAGRHGRKTFTREHLELLTNEEIDAIYDTGNVGEWASTYRRRMRRHADWDAGRESWMKRRDWDVKMVETEHRYRDRQVIIPHPQSVNHPGYEGSRFLTRAAQQVMASRYGSATPRSVPRRRSIASKG